MGLKEAINNIWASDYAQSNPRKSYKAQWPTEYASVSGFLNGGPEPNWSGFSRFGKGLCEAEVERRKAIVVPVPPPVVVAKYAARTGSDSNPGTLASPFLTVDKLCNSLGNGETGIVRGGTYDEHISGGRFAIYMPNAGSSAKADGITLKAYPGEKVEIHGPCKISRHWFRMEGIKVNSRPYDDARDECWWSDGNDHYFLNCDFMNNYGDGQYYDSKGSAAFVTGDRCIYDHCTFHSVLWDQKAGTNQPHGIYAVDTDGLVVKNCKFWGIGAGPVNGQFSVQLYPSGANALIQNNIFDGVNSGVVFGDVTNSIVEKNIFSNTGYYQNGVYVLGSGSGNAVRDNHGWKLGVAGLMGGPGSGSVESNSTSGDPVYTNAAGHVYFPFTGAGTTGKGTDW